MKIMDETNRTRRKNVIEHLQLLASAQEQREYQRNVPFVNITVELSCMWFDGYFCPEAKEQLSPVFSERESEALREFDRVFDSVTEPWSGAGDVPELEDFMRTPQWERMSQAATVALKAFAEASYREMAADEAREAEALEWIEATIGDIDGSSEVTKWA